MRRVVVTGMGLVCPLGLNTKTTWENILKSKSGIGLIPYFDTSKFPVKIAGCLPPEFDATAWMEPKEVKRMDLFIQYVMVAVAEAISNSGLMENISDKDLENIGVIIGSGIGGLR